jgi:hypothetical protein
MHYFYVCGFSLVVMWKTRDGYVIVFMTMHDSEKVKAGLGFICRRRSDERLCCCLEDTMISA